MQGFQVYDRHLLFCQVNSTPLAARAFSVWRQEVLLRVHRIITEAGASVAPSMADLALDLPV